MRLNTIAELSERSVIAEEKGFGYTLTWVSAKFSSIPIIWEQTLGTPQPLLLLGDAALFADLDEIRMRAIVRNDKGEVMAVISAGGPSVVDREEAEIMAWEKALALL